MSRPNGPSGEGENHDWFNRKESTGKIGHRQHVVLSWLRDNPGYHTCSKVANSVEFGKWWSGWRAHGNTKKILHTLWRRRLIEFDRMVTCYECNDGEVVFDVSEVCEHGGVRVVFGWPDKYGYCGAEFPEVAARPVKGKSATKKAYRRLGGLG